MAYVYFLFVSLFLYNINSVSSVVYSCDQNAACGCSKKHASLDKIVGGESAVNSSWGWAVSLQKGTSRHFCGGAILSPLHIITAAHCVTNTSDIIQNAKVVVGIDILLQSATSIAQVRSIIRVISHPQYDKNSKANDIAILRLDQPLSISTEKNTARLCLPTVVPANRTNNYPIPGSSLVAIGWGILRSTDLSIPVQRHLQQVTLNSLPARHSMCALTIRDPKLQFCAGRIGGGKDTCQGDSGGPLMYFDFSERRWVLAGVTSYGIDCGLPSYAGVYTRASVYYDWLRSTVTDGFVQVLFNDTSSDFTDSATSISVSYWLLALSLYIFAQI